jgi:hypothetical protein
LIIANTDPANSITADFRFTHGDGALVVVDPEHPEPRTVSETVTIAPRSVAVILQG